MNYLSENATPLDATKRSSIENMIFEFNIEKLDYFLTFKINWQVISTGIYQFKIGDAVFSIPSGHFILIGDDSGELDWIKVDEMAGREIECLTFDKHLSSWAVHTPKLLDYTEGQFFWPATSNAIPIIDNERILIVAERDHYHKTKQHMVDIFLGNN